jgi:hypothetical protein
MVNVNLSTDFYIEQLAPTNIRLHLYMTWPVHIRILAQYNASTFCNQCLSPLKLWVRIQFMVRCNKVCQWLATGQWFSPGTPISSTNKIDRHDKTEIFESGVKHHNPNSGKQIQHPNPTLNQKCKTGLILNKIYWGQYHKAVFKTKDWRQQKWYLLSHVIVETLTTG